MSERETVRWVHSLTGGSHIEPPLNPSWSDDRRLQWKAAVCRLDAGIEFDVVEAYVTRYGNPLRGLYSIQHAGGQMGAHTFEDTWDIINGICLGAQLARASREA